MAIASGLSLIGALAVIFVYICEKVCRELRECRERQEGQEPPDRDVLREHAYLILAFASIADIIVAVSHIWGIIKLDEYLRGVYAQGEDNNLYVNVECGAQAILAVYGTIASFLWINLFALYICARHSGDCIDRLSNCDTKKCIRVVFDSQLSFACFNLFGWGIPFILIVVLGGTASFGFEKDVDFGKQ